MKIEVKVPEVGESIQGGVLSRWLALDGAWVAVDQPLFELETDKVSLTVSAERAGILGIGITAPSDVKVGQAVAWLDPDARAPVFEASVVTAPAAPLAAPPTKAAPRAPALDELPPGARFFAEEHHVDLSVVEATGRGGRTTREDVQKALVRASEYTPPGPTPPIVAPLAPPAPVASAVSPDEKPRQTRVAMSPLRQRIAERLVQSLQTTAQLTTFNEVDCSRVMALRTQYKDAFQEHHHTSLGFMSFFVKATVDALKTVPALGAQIEGDELVYNNYFDIGVAVSTPRGLVVPVLRDVDRLSFAEVEAAIVGMGARAREGRLTLSELTGGVFTISNGGVFGSLFSTPIVNPPQCGILGMHTIKRRPVVVDDQIVIRPMMYLALSYDHRVVDGEQAVTFLKRIVQCVENPERLLLGV